MTQELETSSRIRATLPLLATLYVGYGAMMICRQMVTILSPALLADEALALSKTDVADIAAWGTIGALCGKFVWGPLGDAIGGRKTFLCGIFLSSLSLIAFAQLSSAVAFIIAAFFLYAAKAAGWPAMTKIVQQTYSPSEYGTVWSILSTSSRLSVVVGTIGFGLLLGYLSWEQVCMAAAVLGVIVWLISRNILPLAQEQLEEVSSEVSSLGVALVSFVRNRRCLLMFAMMMGLTSLMAFLDFLPMYLYEVYGLAPGDASLASSAFPLGCFVGLLASGAVYDRLAKKSVRRILTIEISLAAAIFYSLNKLYFLPLAPELQVYVVAGSVLFLGFLIAPAYYIPSSVFAIEFGKAHSATLVCVIDAFGFAASALFNLAGGRVAEYYGWGTFMYSVGAIAIVTAITTWMFLHAEYRWEQRLSD